MAEGRIFVGVGGWDYDPWRETFYEASVKKADQLAWMAQRLTAIEINGTFYRAPSADSCAKWAAAVPDGFQFSVKASRYCVARKVLADGAESIDRFLSGGIGALGDRLGPILWQFAATKRFDRDDIAAFLKLLPASLGGRPLRHAVEPRHESFRDPAFLDLLRDHGTATAVFADADDYPSPVDIDTPALGGFHYARLQRSRAGEAAGYSAAEIDRWAATARGWAKDGDVFLVVISGATERNPAAALALLARLGDKAVGSWVGSGAGNSR